MEETQATDTGADEVTETLDDVISEYNVQAPPAQVSSQPEVQSPVQPVPKVDPLDENQFQNFTQSVAQNTTALNSQIRELSDKLTHIEQREAELRIETDINSAVSEVNDGLNLDPKLVRVHLELTAQEKPAFKKVWENRHNDPKTYSRALSAIKKEIGNTYSVRQDPELTETQAAIQQSQRSMASTSGQKQTNSAEERLSGAKSQAEFDREWQRMLGH
jgi:uncharacterized protein YukE